MSITHWTRGRLTGLCAVLTLALALCTGASAAAAAPRMFGFVGADPVIDGNGDDLINFASGVAGTSCAVDRPDDRDDIVIADPLILVCGSLEDTTVPPDGVSDYFINGFDLRRFVLVYDRPNKNLYMLFRMEGFVGDVDGNGNPDNNQCPPTVPSFGDQPGIGSQENYQVRIDTNCDGLPEVEIKVGGLAGEDLITVIGATAGATSLAYRPGAGTGKDLEVLVSNITLPDVFRISANANASFDGLGEDITSTATCGNPAPSIDLTKSVNVPVICPGGSADFTMVVTNTGNVDLAGITLVDNLPAGLTYTSTVSNTCGGAVNAVGNQITYGPFNLAVGASCTIVLRVGRTAECTGEQTNNASVEGSFTSPCVNGGLPILVNDNASASILCGNVVCSIDAPDTRVCPGETVEICGPAGDFSYLWSTGATTRCITVGAGPYSLTVTDNVSGCVSTNPCQVTIVEDPRPNCTIDAPDTRVCPGETVQICGPAGDYTYLWNTGATTRCINVGAGPYSLVITSTVTGCVSNNECAVTIVEDPRPNCTIDAPDTRVCPGETVQICGPVGDYTYLWNTGATTRCINVGAGPYSLVITSTVTGCVSNNECAVTIVEDPRPNCTIDAPDTRVCPGETVQICGPVGDYTYLWNTGATTRCINVGAGPYSLVITSTVTGCVSNNECAVTIVEDPRPNCTIDAPDTRVCPGETVQICGPAGDFSYLWNTGATTRCITVGAGTYSLVITSTATGCAGNNTCEVTIVEDPRPVCEITSDKDAVCQGETARLCGPEGPYSYLWSTGATTRCIDVGAGTYSLVITNTQTGCVSNNTCEKTIIPRSLPCVEVAITPIDALCVGEAFELCGTVKNCGTAVADLEVDYNGVKRNFTAVPAGETREWCIPAVMPACSNGIATFDVTGKATNDCGPITQPASESINCKVPQIDVEKVARETSVANLGTIHYSITVRNPSSTVALSNVVVVDDLCAYAKWTGVANPAPSIAPNVGSAGGTVTWNIGNLAPLAEVVITFEVTADIAAGGGVCPTTVQCQNDVYATGLCAGGGEGQTPVRDDDSITTPITCAGEACPRTVGFWGVQCAQKGNGSTKFTLTQMTQIAECIDEQSSFFNWSAGTDFEMLCRTLSTSNMTVRVQAKRQFAGVLANVCTDVLNLQPSQGGKIYLDPATAVSCAGLESDTIGELIDEVDAILAELEGMSLNDPAVKHRYGQLISCLDAINNGMNISVREDCEHGGTTTPTGDATEFGDDASVDAGASVELYRPFPNPFTGATAFAYKVDASDAAVDITVYDVAGRQIRKLVSGVQTAGQYTASWDGRNDAGAKATRGVYFVRTIIAGAKANTSRVLYLSE